MGTTAIPFDLENPPSDQWKDEQDRSEWFEAAASYYASRVPSPGQLATISFQPEAHDTAASFCNMLSTHRREVHQIGALLSPAANERGYTVTVVPFEGDQFDAEVLDVSVGDDGQYKVVLAPWDEEADHGDRAKARAWDLYDELQRIEVI